VADGAEVGFLWLSLPGTFYATMAWVSEIDVVAAVPVAGLRHPDDAGRRGRPASAAAVHRLGLHVFAATTAPAASTSGWLSGPLQVRAARRATARRPALELIPMTDREFAARVAASSEHDPIVLTANPGAGATAPGRSSGVAPRGVRGEGVFARVAMGRRERVGWIWFRPARPVGSDHRMVHYLAVDEGQAPARHGRAMTRPRRRARAHGVPNLGLISPGTPGGHPRRDALGFSLLSQQMVKDLSAQLP